jgi:FkbH-like protein
MTDEFRQQLKEIKDLIADNKYDQAIVSLRANLKPTDDFIHQHRCTKLLGSIPAKALGLQDIRVSIVGTATIDYLADILRLWLALDGFNADFQLAEFNTLDQSVLDPKSQLYAFSPDIIWLFTTHRDVELDVVPGASPQTVEGCLGATIDRFTGLWQAAQAYSSAHIIQNNADIPADRVFGNFEGGTSWGRVNALRRFNLMLAEAAVPGVTVLDFDFLSSQFGKRSWFDARHWYHSKNAVAFDALGLVSFQAARIIRTIRGQADKCVVLDLDNTLWGGVIGDDGLDGIVLGNGPAGEAYADFQSYLLDLKERGIILAVCSKNEEDTAKSPFLEHPEMKLRLEDIAVFVANWENKADNVRDIAETLGIGVDSLVFIDDNPAERELIRRELPAVTVPELPRDPSLFIRALDSQHCFETVAFSTEDANRSAMYRANVVRKTTRRTHTDLSSFLKDLCMEAIVADFDQFHLSRISQLINKSNQFHLTTTRYSETEIKAMMDDPQTMCRYVKLRDRFGDNGLISVIILKPLDDTTLSVDTWVMSCRVLSRGVEEFVCNHMIADCRKHGFARVVGTYLPTKKNKLASDLYQRLDFRQLDTDGRDLPDDATLWELTIDAETKIRDTFVEDITADCEGWGTPK